MNQIARYRKAAKLTQKALGECIGVSQGAVGNYELGQRNVDLETGWKIVNVLNFHKVKCKFCDVFPNPQ
ncbi:helix-turn-helix transcriptional regulator [Shewanella glacialimarina]|jgi:transcriptional regulator with XRE-family HTH domain|uniref:helix-turn-helix transcriptional regulator n=1 Tax=Shewanella glacialimarina TaxID=2590884 RepID=UPI001CF8C7E3|nr:helix-turn-helix transcriptional regulator [Shewanella glacialimarina]UCX03547.1 helix-turn-helix transcriptional regulator [Shewanella glacialimarina]